MKLRLAEAIENKKESLKQERKLASGKPKLLYPCEQAEALAVIGNEVYKKIPLQL